MAFAVALDACIVGECGQLFGFLTNYLGDSEAAIKDQISALFKPWMSAANLLSDGFDQMVNITSGVGGQVDEVEKDVKTLVADFCSTPTVCANNTLEALKKEGRFLRFRLARSAVTHHLPTAQSRTLSAWRSKSRS